MKQPWGGRAWMNLPYSSPLAEKFLEKMSKHNNGIALVFSMIEAKWFYDVVLSHVKAVKFLYERIRFFRPDGTKGMPPRNGSRLVAYSRENAIVLTNNMLKGKFVFL